MSKISVIIKHPTRKPYHTNIENTLENFQRNIGGYIECVSFPNFTIVCDEEGLLKGLPYNCTMFGIDFYGSIIFAGTNKDEFTDFIDFKEFKKLFYDELFKEEL